MEHWLKGYCALLVLCCLVSVYSDDTVAARVPYRRLTWDDFQGPPPDDGASAKLFSGFDYSFSCVTQLGRDGRSVSRIANIAVNPYMDPANSGVKEEKKSDRLLRHEQCHFDITEYFSRKLAAELSTLWAASSNSTGSVRAVSEAAQRLADKITAEWQATQARYDEETEQSRNEEAQKQWEEWVAEKLKALPRPASVHPTGAIGIYGR